jgi:hypothetical protein
MSARSPDWRSGANPSGVGLDAFLDAARASGRLARAFTRPPRHLSVELIPTTLPSPIHTRCALHRTSVNPAVSPPCRY